MLHVDPSIHKRFEHADARPVHGAVAFNSAIRRSRGRFVGSKACDSFFSNELVALLADQKLQEDGVYRVDRCDVDPSVLETSFDDLDGFLDACERLTRSRAGRLRVWAEIPNLHTNASGDFTLASRPLWDRAHGFYETPDVSSHHSDSLTLYVLHAVGGREIALEGPLCVYKLAHPNLFVHMIETRRSRIWKPIHRLSKRVLRPAQANLLGIFLADGLGLERTGRRDMPGVRLPSNVSILRTCRRIVRGRGRFLLNGDDWGLRGEDLPEWTLCRAAWDR